MSETGPSSSSTARALPPGPGQVRIRVAFVGLCGTDLHIVHGSMDRRVQVPLIFGHEMSGTIDSVGDGVDGWSTGDKVTVMPLVWDGDVPRLPRRQHAHLPEPQLHRHRLPRRLTTAVERARLDPRPTATFCGPARRRSHRAGRGRGPRRTAGRVSAGDKIVVVGGGPIGFIIATVARDFGGDVTVVELDPTRRALAAKLGFVALAPEDRDDSCVARRVDRRRRSGRRVRGVRCRRGSSALPLAKVRGTIVVVGIHPEPRAVDLQRIFWRELTIVGARVYERTDFETAVELVSSGVIPTRALITRVVPLAETQSGCGPRSRQRDEGTRRRPSRAAGRGRLVTNMFDLTGRLAVVTGARRGIGYAMAEALAAAGADIIGVSATLEAEGSAIGAAVLAHGRSFEARAVDFADREAVLALGTELATRAPDILVNNAGTIERAPAIDHPLAAGTESRRST